MYEDSIRLAEQGYSAHNWVEEDQTCWVDVEKLFE